MVQRDNEAMCSADLYRDHVLRDIRSCLWVRQRWHMSHTDRVETAHRNWITFMFAYLKGRARRIMRGVRSEAERRFDGLDVSFEYLYSRLHRPEDRDLLARLAARRALDSESVPLVNVRRERKRLRQLDVDVLTYGGPEMVCDRGWTMPLMNIARYGLPVKFFANGIVLMYSFVRRQYECPAVGFIVHQGDKVIDAGACYGDTALTFAVGVGGSGRVYSFEMVKDSLAVLKENLHQNPELAKRITVFEHPLGETDGEILTLCPGRAGASVTGLSEHANLLEKTNLVTAVTIDSLVAAGEIPHVDIIKMDIEGAEIMALRGAQETIRRQRPRMAICVYHRDEDFITIPQLIDSFDQNYQFVLGHHSGSTLETVLYCY